MFFCFVWGHGVKGTLDASFPFIVGFLMRRLKITVINTIGYITYARWAIL